MAHAPRRDAEERDLQLVTDALRRLLKDKPTERALRRLAKAALGEAPDGPPTPAEAGPLT
jgi:hypothetical protein